MTTTPFKTSTNSSSTMTTTTPGRTGKNIMFNTPSGSSTSSRLLYRGALSLPDSYLLLDGLTFSARLESPMKHHLLENPIALALESMRGRQSLRFLGIVKLDEIWLDESGNVEMDIHPRATLSKIYFENIFCLLPFPAASTSSRLVPDPTPGSRSEFGIKIAIGDTDDGPETTHIVIYAQASNPNTRTIRFCVARITTRPPPTKLIPPNRIARPDDPIPRRPPITFGQTSNSNLSSRSNTIASTRELKRVLSTSSSSLGNGNGNGVVVKRQKLTKGNSSAKLDFGDSSKVFKVPTLPGKVKGKGKEKEDVFSGKGGILLKKKDSIMIEDDFEKSKDKGEGDVEQKNKNLIKKATLEHLCRTKDPTLQRNVDRNHPEFKEIWGGVYRGTTFALRADMKTTQLEKWHIQPLIDAHTRMYVGGRGTTQNDGMS